MPAAAPRLDQLYSYADYATWTDDQRWELHEGVPIAMSPAPGEAHQTVAGAVYAQLYLFLKGKSCKAYIAPLDVLLAESGDREGSETTVLQPDVLVICDRTRITRRGIRGAPDLVVEVLSPSNTSHDEKNKFRIYERHGVREYWIISPEARVAKQYIAGVEGSFQAAVIFSETQKLPSTVLPGFELDLAEVFSGD
ncbi:MAG: Uma2 family endonuclease [Spirochaetales bacterium]|nr:Uma2 family endonuclease [Spirochaetales bacterium]